MREIFNFMRHSKAGRAAQAFSFFLTEPAEYLTLRDMNEMMRAGCLRGLPALVRRLGGNPEVLLRKHHIPAEALENEDSLVPLRPLINLAEECAEVLQAPDFGLQAAQVQDVGVLGSLALAIQHAPTIGDAFNAASKYQFIHSPAVEYSCVELVLEGRPVAELRWEILLPRLPPARQTYDLALGLVHRINTMLNEKPYPLLGVKLPHTPLASSSRYKQYFGAPVEFEQPCAALIVDRAFFNQPINRADSKMHDFIKLYLEMNFPSKGQTASSRVRRSLVKALEINRAELESVAQMLSIHPRKLQRDLAEEGTTFERVRDEVRRDAAARYLTTTKLPLSQVAAALGISEQSAFTRSCKAWFGMSPLKYRRQAADVVRNETI